MKKSYCRMFCLVLFAAIFAVSAAGSSSGHSQGTVTPIHASALEAAGIGDSLVLDDGAKLTKLSRSDFIDQVGASQNVSAQAAEKLLSASQAKAVNLRLVQQEGNLKARGGSCYYFNYSREFHLQNQFSNPYRATLGAALYLWSDGQSARIEQVCSVYTAMVPGLSRCTWAPLAGAYNVPARGSFPAGAVDLLGDGQFTVTSPRDAGVPENLQGLGFTASTGGSEDWTSEILHMVGTYRCCR